MKALFLPGNIRDGFVSWSDISDSASICDNNNYTCSVTSGGSSFNWTVSSNLSIVSGQGASQITITKIFNGPATVSVRNQEVCSTRSIVVGPPQFAYFTVNGQPTSSASVCVNDYASVEALPFLNASYAWSLSPLGNASLTNYYCASTAFTSYIADCYLLSLQISNACGSTQVNLTICAQNCFVSYKVYPNPAKDYVTVESDKIEHA